MDEEQALEQVDQQASQEQQESEAAEAAAFSATFEEAPAIQAAAPEDATPAQEAQPAADAEELVDDVVEVELSAQDKLNKLVDDLTSKSGATETQLRQAFGKIGELSRTLTELKEAGSGKANVRLGKEQFKRLNDEYPDLAELLAEDLAEALGSNVAAPDSDAVANLVSERVAQARAELQNENQVKLQQAILTLSHRDWANVYQTPDFQAWVQTQSQQDQELMHNGWDAMAISDKLTEYKSTLANKQQAAQKNAQRLQRNLTPGSLPAGKRGAATEEDGFNAVFAT